MANHVGLAEAQAGTAQDLSPVVPIPNYELISEDGVPLETVWHRLSINLLAESLWYHWRGRDDYFCGGNMVIYFNPDRNKQKDFRGPDFFLVQGVNRLPARESWVAWHEGGKLPKTVIELMSPSTRAEDLGPKKDIYQNVFQTQNYFCYDPTDEQIRGWRLNQGVYESMTPGPDGRFYCEDMDLFLGTWQGSFQGQPGKYLRFFDQAGNLLPTAVEAAEGQLHAERQRVEAERQRAEAERQRAEAAEAEVARLTRLLGEQGKNGH